LYRSCTERSWVDVTTTCELQFDSHRRARTRSTGN
jgi:hypothetical protein